MNAALRTLACLLVGACPVLADASASNRVVVLDNENLVEGEVSKVAGGFQIRRAVGGDMVLPFGRVLAVVADRKEAFSVVAERANRRDADEHLRLARWCSANGLSDEALVEARTAARMRPGFTAAERYVQTLEALAKKTPTVDPAVVPAKAETPARDTVTDVPALDYNSESFPLFAGKVNAVLMNTCATCHAREDMKPFPLTRVSGRGGATRNLMAALAQVNPADPATSPILLKAITPHGGATEAPLKTRLHPAYQTLETWARFARAPEGTGAPEGPLPAKDPTEPRKLPELPSEKFVSGSPASGGSFGQDSKTVPPRPTKTEATDPFDPAIFNGEVKPKK
jgi:hypothetical protein